MYYWSAAEPITGVLCCCLLTYVPLFRNFRADNQKRAGQEDCALEAAAYHRRCNSGKYLNSDSNDTLTALTATYTVSNVLGELSYLHQWSLLEHYDLKVLCLARWKMHTWHHDPIHRLTHISSQLQGNPHSPDCGDNPSSFSSQS